MVERSPGVFDLDGRLAELSAEGGDLECLKAIVNFEIFRPAFGAAVLCADGAKGGRPAFDLVMMFKALILHAMHALSNERTEPLIKDRLSFLHLRESLKKAGAIDSLFRRFDEALRSDGFLAMSGQIVDATIVAVPKQRNTIEVKTAIKEARVPGIGGTDRPS